MQFRFHEDQLAIRDAVRAFCAAQLDLADVAGREGKQTDLALWLALADLGVLGLLVQEPGSGVGIVEASLVFEELGAHLVTGPVLWSTIAAAFVEGVATGDVRVAGVELDDPMDGPVAVDHAVGEEVVSP
jgi:alkylation response protein AidB-like acyl-CoA dehydrogenase